MADNNHTRNWIIVSVLILISLGATTLILQPDSFEKQLKDGSIKVKYSEGIFKAYEGRYLAFQDSINIYYWNGKGYTTMYKARGNKYSNLSYSQEGDIAFVKQDIYYSKGNLTRYFEITEYTIKESFEWTPIEEELRVYFLWNYDKLDEDQPALYVDSSNKQLRAKMDFGVINDWENEIDNIVRVERYKNGKLTIRTRVYEGPAFFDPDLKLETDITKVIKDDIFKELISNDASKTEAVFTLENPMKTEQISREDIKVKFNEVCGKVNSYKLLINSTCEAERI